MPKRRVIAFSSESEASPDKAPVKPAKKRLRSGTAGQEVLQWKPGVKLGTVFGKDSEGQAYSITEEVTNNTGGVHFIIKRGGTTLFGNCGSYNRASFSLASQACRGQTVKLDRFQLPLELRRQGHGTWALRLLMKLYASRGCACIEIPAPTAQGHRLYKKCGFTDEHQIGLQYDFTKKSLPDTPAREPGRRRPARLSRTLYSKQVHV